MFGNDKFHAIEYPDALVGRVDIIRIWFVSIHNSTPGQFAQGISGSYTRHFFANEESALCIRLAISFFVLSQASMYSSLAQECRCQCWLSWHAQLFAVRRHHAELIQQ